MLKLALGVEYNGKNYYGWQSQQKVSSIQNQLEDALSQVANHQVSVCCAGRTDARVHSIGQVVHFETTAYRTQNAWTIGVNTKLAHDIAIRWVQEVPIHFHARFSAIARHYRYVIYNHRLRPAILNNILTHFCLPLDAEKMHQAGQYLVGENDFTSFKSIHCQSKTSFRTVMYLNVRRQGLYVIIDIKANAFLHHMVRNIVGSLIEIGCGKRSEKWISTVLAAKDRSIAAFTAKPDGLYLVGVDYPSCFELPGTTTEHTFFDCVY